MLKCVANVNWSARSSASRHRHSSPASGPGAAGTSRSHGDHRLRDERWNGADGGSTHPDPGKGRRGVGGSRCWASSSRLAIGVSADDLGPAATWRRPTSVTASIGHAGLIGALQDERNLALLSRCSASQDGSSSTVGDTDRRPRARPTPPAPRCTTRSPARHGTAARRLRRRPRAALDRPRRGAGDRSTRRAAARPGQPRGGPRGRSPRTRTWSATLFASHDRFSLVVDDPALRQGDDLVHYSSHATDAVAQLVERLLYLGQSPGGVDEPARGRRGRRGGGGTSARNNRPSRSGPTATTRAVRRRRPTTRGCTGLARPRRRSGRPGRQVDPRRAAGHGAARPRRRLPGVPRRGRRGARRPGRRPARRGRRRAAALRGRRRGALVAAALLVAWLVSRSITRPLRDLSVQAAADGQLPPARGGAGHPRRPGGRGPRRPRGPADRAPGPATRSATWPRAFNDVQSSALGLAVEQAALRRNVAESYVNLGRRNQNLLSRLLDAVGELERDGARPRAPRRSCTSSTTWPPASAATPSRCWCCREPMPPARWQPPVQVVATWCGRPSARSRTTSGCWCARSSRRWSRARPSADLAHLLAELDRERAAPLAAPRAGRGERPGGRRRRLRRSRSSTTAWA